MPVATCGRAKYSTVFVVLQSWTESGAGVNLRELWLNVLNLTATDSVVVTTEFVGLNLGVSFEAASTAPIKLVCQWL